MTPQDLQNLIAKLEGKLARQTNALNLTVTELATLENTGEFLGKNSMLYQLRIKRMRQHNAVQATEGYLKVLKSTTGVKKGA